VTLPKPPYHENGMFDSDVNINIDTEAPTVEAETEDAVTVDQANVGAVDVGVAAGDAVDLGTASVRALGGLGAVGGLGAPACRAVARSSW
jgi:hypothetical protein